MYIKEVLVKKIWRRGDMLWRLDEDVNVLVGANGSGKSTILNLMYEALQPLISEEAREKYFSLVGDVVIELSDGKFIFVDSSNSNSRFKNQ
jgi:predicted ATP-binding protein involved in virulence